MSEMTAKFDMYSICRDIPKLNGSVHLDPAGIILDGEFESIGLVPSLSHAVVGTAEKEAPVVFRPTTPYAGSGNAN